MKSLVRRLVLGVFFVAFGAGALHGQSAKFFSLGVGASTFKLDNVDSSQTGGYFGFELGIPIKDWVSIRGAFDLAVSDGQKAKVAAVSLGPRFFLTSIGDIRPFMDLSATYSFYDMGFLGLDGRGLGASAGLGFQYRIADMYALDVRATARRSYFGDTRYSEIKLPRFDDYAWQFFGGVGITISFW